MSTSQTIRAHAQEVWGKSDKIKGGCQLERKAGEMISYSKMPLPKSKKVLRQV